MRSVGVLLTFAGVVKVENFKKYFDTFHSRIKIKHK